MGLRQRALADEFAAAYQQQVDFVWRILARQGVPDSALEDATQEVFIVAHRRWGVWEPDPLRPWLYGVARRVAATHHRSQGRELRKRAALPSPAPAPSIDERLEDRARLDVLAAAIAALEPEQREVFSLVDLDELSAPEAARALGCKLNTVYSRLRRARAKVARALAHHEADGSTAPRHARSERSGAA